MKNYLLYITFCIILIGFYSCSKDTPPTIRLISVTPLLDGTVSVKAELISEDENNIGEVGFCCSPNSTPELLDNQLISSLSNNSFEASYEGLTENNTYNFRSWTTTENGTFYSNTGTIDVLTYPTVDPPCSLSQEYLSTGLGLTSGTGTYIGSHNVTIDNSTNTYQISGSTPYATVNISLASPLVQGLYTTTSFNEIGYREMFVSFTQGQYYTLKPGSNIYVKTISPGVYDLTICDAPYLFNGSTWVNFNTRLTATN